MKDIVVEYRNWLQEFEIVPEERRKLGRLYAMRFLMKRFFDTDSTYDMKNVCVTNSTEFFLVYTYDRHFSNWSLEDSYGKVMEECLEHFEAVDAVERLGDKAYSGIVTLAFLEAADYLLALSTYLDLAYQHRFHKNEGEGIEVRYGSSPGMEDRLTIEDSVEQFQTSLLHMERIFTIHPNVKGVSYLGNKSVYEGVKGAIRIKMREFYAAIVTYRVIRSLVEEKNFAEVGTIPYGKLMLQEKTPEEILNPENAKKLIKILRYFMKTKHISKRGGLRWMKPEYKSYL